MLVAMCGPFSNQNDEYLTSIYFPSNIYFPGSTVIWRPSSYICIVFEFRPEFRPEYGIPAGIPESLINIIYAIRNIPAGKWHNKRNTENSGRKINTKQTQQL